MKRQQGTGETEGQGSCRRARQTQDPRMVGGRGTVGKRKDVRGGLRDKDCGWKLWLENRRSWN